MTANPHTHAAILSTGDELVMGQLQDTNARWIAERLTERGIRVVEAAMVGDDLDGLVGALERLSKAAPLVVMSGGLGATDGDLTRQALCRLTGDTLVTDEAIAASLGSYLRSRGRDLTERQMRQAQRPSRATPLPNAVGTAPGLHTTVRTTDLVCLPGPPGELRPMWLTHVEPLLRPDPSRAVRTRLLYAAGMPEADAADRLRTLTERGRDITVNLTASGGILTVRTRAEGAGTPDLHARYEATLQAIHQALGDHCFAEAPASDAPATERLCTAVLDALKAAGQTLATVESCTGGMLGQMLTAIPGSSAAYVGGLVTYSNALKSTLALVDAPTIAEHGAVSRRVAACMAVGGVRATGASHALAITGIAGPDGGSPEKPVGTVWIARATDGGALHDAEVRCFRFTGDRHDVRVRSCVTALTMLLFALRDRPLGRLLWQHVP
ncbi:MAG TPA: nicotinamide-nucleotide amidohydrolase family protein [Phycisphaerales bacterium]|nr:nicotinamide-nucleotide amidohydrolase family protein [Phycisphaerales bacterium]